MMVVVMGFLSCNDFYKMNCQSFEWSKIHPRNEGSLWPSKKAGCCGLVTIECDHPGLLWRIWGEWTHK